MRYSPRGLSGPGGTTRRLGGSIVPPRGYWARVQHGQKIPRPPLPEVSPEEGEEIVIRVRE